MNTCTSCDLNSDFGFFFKNECLKECPAEISVVTDGKICEECDHSCLTCEERSDKCLTCPQHMKLDPIAFTCSAECQPETQIYNPDLEHCDTCNETCSKCRGDVNYCTECKPGFVLNKDNSC